MKKINNNNLVTISLLRIIKVKSMKVIRKPEQYNSNLHLYARYISNSIELFLDVLLRQ